MDQRTEGILLIALMIALSLVFQVQMKLFASTLGPLLAKAQDWRGTVSALVAASFCWRGFLIVILAGLLFLLWLLALTRLELSFALPIASIAFVITAVGGGLWLGEDLNWVRILGLITTAVGIGLVVRS
jgi:drug/metabolite transporter (DMT)-like permease